MATIGTEEVVSKEEATTNDPKEGVEETSTQETEEVEGTKGTEEESVETPTDEASEEEEEAAPPEDEEEPDEDDDLSDDDLDNLLTAYGDRIQGRPGLKDVLSRQVKTQVDREVQEATKGVEGSRQVEGIIQKGQQAIQSLATQVTGVADELAKAQRGEEFNAGVFDQQQLVSNLREYGSAIVAEQAHRYDSAVEGAYESLFGSDGLPLPTEEQSDILRQAMEIAQRMEGDPNQSAQAKTFFFKSIFRFVADRALEQGASQEQTRVKSQKSVKERIAKSAARKAGKADAEAEKTPPRTGKSKARTGSSEPSMELYKELKAEGKKAEAQAVVDAMASGVPVGAGVS